MWVWRHHIPLWTLIFYLPLPGNGLRCVCNENKTSVAVCYRDSCQLNEGSPELLNEIPACLAFNHSKFGILYGCGSVEGEAGGTVCGQYHIQAGDSLITRCWCTDKNFCNLNIFDRVLLPDRKSVIPMKKPTSRRFISITPAPTTTTNFMWNIKTKTQKTTTQIPAEIKTEQEQWGSSASVYHLPPFVVIIVTAVLLLMLQIR